MPQRAVQLTPDETQRITVLFRGVDQDNSGFLVKDPRGGGL